MAISERVKQSGNTKTLDAAKPAGDHINSSDTGLGIEADFPLAQFSSKTQPLTRL
nr:hypothetical protein [Methylomarinum sp. Ch1-1]MDP4521235.1 hypothetical protein [Methylomarinum sp. Ch1-1]